VSGSLDLVWLGGALVLAVMALSVRRMSFSTIVRSLLGWMAITLFAFLAISHRYEIGAVFSAVSAGLGIDDQQVQGKTVRIRMGPDGHFWARVTLNGVERRMLIDSGATITAISEDTAQAAGIQVENSGFPVMIETANGTVAAKRGTLERLQVGPLATKDLGVVISANFGDMDVLGMNFLSRLKSWRVEEDTLVLDPGDKSEEGETIRGDEDRNLKTPRPRKRE